MLNITRDTGEFLSVLVRATLATRILEIGVVESPLPISQEVTCARPLGVSSTALLP